MKRFIIFTLLILVATGLFNLTTVSAQPDDRPSEMLMSSPGVTRAQALDALATFGEFQLSGQSMENTENLSAPATVARVSTNAVNGANDFIFKNHAVASEVFILICLFFLLPQGIFTVYWMLFAWNDPEKVDQFQSPKHYSAPQFSFTALLPARKEEMVIKDTIYAVNAIDYPEHLKEILILIRDDDDDGTIAQANEAIAELGNPNIRLVTFTDGPRNKPNGLNRGLAVTSNNVVCIFDAEDEPHPELYHIVNTVMQRDGADVVQSGVQLMNHDSTWFSALNCLEYFFWFKSGLHFFTRMLNVTPLGGNTVFFKKEWLDRIGGWDEGLLTEDADVGIRMSSQGAKIQIVYDAQHVTQEETPATVEDFIKQRTRWSQGFYEIFAKGDWKQLPSFKQKLGATYILLNPLLQAAMILYLPLGIFVALTQRVTLALAVASYIPLGILLIEMLITMAGILEFAATYEKRLPRLFLAKMALVHYPFQILLAVASFRAIYRFITGHSAWEKTTHSNMHRTSATVRTESVS
jgi:cellulose synthase/poly-beta-1,6-N-acetylglucosamine synthase-like glycosyltransferase